MSSCILLFIFSHAFKNTKTILSLQAMQRESNGPDLPVGANADSWPNINLIHKKTVFFLVKWLIYVPAT